MRLVLLDSPAETKISHLGLHSRRGFTAAGHQHVACILQAARQQCHDVSLLALVSQCIYMHACHSDDPPPTTHTHTCVQGGNITSGCCTTSCLNSPAPKTSMLRRVTITARDERSTSYSAACTICAHQVSMHHLAPVELLKPLCCVQQQVKHAQDTTIIPADGRWRPLEQVGARTAPVGILKDQPALVAPGRVPHGMAQAIHIIVRACKRLAVSVLQVGADGFQVRLRLLAGSAASSFEVQVAGTDGAGCADCQHGVKL